VIVWLRDHVLPGLITAALIGASHMRLWHRIKKLTREQTKTLKADTEEQDHG